MISPERLERTALEDRAAVERERAKRLMAMGQMAASLAHEIRNPLGSMELYCSLLKQDLHDSPAALDLAEQIHSGIRRLDRIIGNCLQFSRDVVPKKKLLNDTSGLLAGALSDVKALSEASEVAVEFAEQGGHEVSVDPFLVHQVLVNVVRNAVEAAAEKAEGPRNVSIFSDRSSALRWTLLVVDNGPGIGTEDCERVFDPFVSGKPGGTGLGLAIVHSIVKAHGGSVALRSKQQEGTVVEIEFPTAGRTVGAEQRQ